MEWWDDAVLEMRSEKEIKPVPKRVVLQLFAGLYFTPLLLYALSGLILGGPFRGFLAGYIALVFPSGLTAVFVPPNPGSNGDYLLGFALIGYLTYGSIFTLAILFRKHWQNVALLFVVFVFLLGLNLGGCKKVAEDQTSRISAP